MADNTGLLIDNFKEGIKSFNNCFKMIFLAITGLFIFAVTDPGMIKNEDVTVPLLDLKARLLLLQP